MDSAPAKSAEKAADKRRPNAPALRRLREAVDKAMQGGGPERVAAQKTRGKFTAR